MPSKLGDDTRRQGIVFVGTADEILNEQVLAGSVREHVLLQQREVLRRHRLVVFPPDLIIGVPVTNDKLIARRAAGMLAGQGAQGTMGGQLSLAPANRFFIEGGGRKVITSTVCAPQTDRRQLYRRVVDSEQLHGLSLPLRLVPLRTEGDRTGGFFKTQ